MSTSVELSAPAAPALMKTLQKEFPAHRQKGYIFLWGVEGPTRLPFLFQMLLNQALMFIFSFLKGAGAGAERSTRARDHLYSPSQRWVDLRTGYKSARRGEEEKAKELEKTLFNKGLF